LNKKRTRELIIISVKLHIKRTSLLKYLKIELDTNLKIILLERQNNYVGRSSWLLECQNILQHYSSCLKD